MEQVTARRPKMTYVTVKGTPTSETGPVTVVGLQTVLENDVYIRVMNDLGFVLKDGKLSGRGGSARRMTNGGDIMDVYYNPAIVLNKLSAVGFEVITSASYSDFSVIWTLGREK